MSIAPWLLPVLWREHDWRAALERLARELPVGSQSQRPALELARACEYIEPDRRRAIATYELAGPGGDRGRSRELAIELGWWSARARLTLVARSRDRDPRLLLDEAEAWWDAGQPDLCALALTGVPARDRGVRGEELAALVAERDLADFASEAVARGVSTKGEAAADAYVMAARFSRAAGRTEDVTRWLEAALEAHPRHALAASFLLALVCRERESAGVERFLQLRLADAGDLTAWLDAARASALDLIESGHHRGFGLRLLRQALERAYDKNHTRIPGHLAMWTVLAANASADNTRRELLPLVLEALEICDQPADCVWLGALATEIALRDAKSPVVAGAYAEIVAEHAPEHPILRELVAAVATARPEPEAPAAVPAAAIAAAAHAQAQAQANAAFEIDIDLDDTYAGAVEASLVAEDILEEIDDEPSPVDDLFAPKSTPAPSSAPSAKPASIQPAATKPIEVKPASTQPATTRPIASKPASVEPSVAQPARQPTAASKPIEAKPATVQPSAASKPIEAKPPSAQPSAADPIGAQPAANQPTAARAIDAKPASVQPSAAKATDAKQPSAAKATDAKPASVQPSGAKATEAKPASGQPSAATIGAKPMAFDVSDEPAKPAKPSVAPASIATPAPAGKAASIIPASIPNAASIIPAAVAKSAAARQAAAKPVVAKPASALAQRLPPVAVAAPVLAALRTADRPIVPPAAPSRPDAIPRARRIAIPIDVRLVRADGTKLDGHSRDLSTTGLFVLTGAKLALGEQVSLTLLLPGKEPFTEDEYPGIARVARGAEDGYGLELIAPTKELVAALDALE